MLLYGFSSPIGGFGGIRGSYRNINLIPFHSILCFLSGRNTFVNAINNLLGNIVVFIPLGIYVALLRKNRGTSISLFCVFIISLFYEVLQFVFSRGTSDIDDILLNCLGGLIGIMGYKGLTYYLKTEEKARSTITLLTAVFGIPIFLFIMIDITRIYALFYH